MVVVATTEGQIRKRKKTRQHDSPIDNADVVEVVAALQQGELGLGGDPRRAAVVRADPAVGAEVGHALGCARELVVLREGGRAPRACPDVARPSAKEDGSPVGCGRCNRHGERVVVWLGYGLGRSCLACLWG